MNEISNEHEEIMSRLASANAHHFAAEAHATKAVEEAAKAGADLQFVRGRVSDGQWKRHLKDETSISDRTAQKYMQLNEEFPLLSATNTAGPGASFEPSSITQAMRLIASPDIREELDEKACDGVQLPKKEVDKMLRDAEELRRNLREERAAKEKAESAAAEKEAAINRATEIAMESDRQKRDAAKAADKRHQKLKERYDDLAEVHRDEIKEIEGRIRREERNRPRTNAEEDAHRAEIQALESAQIDAQIKLNELNKELDKAKQEAKSARNSVLLREEIEGKFASALNDLERAAGAMAVASRNLGMIPITTEMYDKMSLVAGLLNGCLDNLEEARSVNL